MSRIRSMGEVISLDSDSFKMKPYKPLIRTDTLLTRGFDILKEGRFKPLVSDGSAVGDPRRLNP
jgi:hypothetical protein